MAAQRLTERFAFSGGKVNREGPVPFVEGVLICGFESANRRTYKPEAWAGERVKRYNGRPVYVNHAQERTAESKLGWFENVTVNAEGKPSGRFCLNPKHPMAEQVLWAAEHSPGFYGMSHVADCDVKRVNGREVIEEILSVASIDLVAEPATVRGFYESEGGQPVVMKFSEWAAKLGGADAATVKPLLTEDADTPIAADTGPTLTDGVNALAHAVIDNPELDTATKRKKLAVILTAGAKLTGESVVRPDDGKAIREALEVCRKVGFRGYDADDLDAIAAMPSDRREALAKKLMGSGTAGAAAGKGEEKPRSITREGIVGPRKTEDKPVPTDGKAFAQLIRE